MLTALVALSALVGSVPSLQKVVAFKAERVILGTRDPETGELTTVAGGYLVVRDGVVVEVGAETPPDGAWITELPGMVLCPGFVDPATMLGAAGDLEEPARAVTAEAFAGNALQPYHSEFREAAEQGVTTVGLSPAGTNLVSGAMAIVHTRTGDGRAELAGEGPLRMSLVEEALSAIRAPTSRMGALDLLRKEVEAGLPGTGALVVEAESADEIRHAVSVLGGRGRPLVLLGAADADRALAQLQGKNVTVVLGPLSAESSPRELGLPKLLDEQGIPLAFTGGGDAGALRLTVALAVRAGLPPGAALAAVTLVPARILGVDASTGTLEPGKRADFLVLSGSPVDLSSRVEGVYVGGIPVERNPAR